MTTHVCQRITAPLVALCFEIAAPLSAQDAIPMQSAPSVSTAADEEPISSEPNPEYWLYARVFGGKRELWAGYLAMTPYGRASVHTDVQEMDANCPVRNNRFAPKRNTVELRIRPGRREGEALYGVEVSWTRPAEPCSDRGTRAAGFDIEVELVDKETRVIEGEGGLRLELTRNP